MSNENITKNCIMAGIIINLVMINHPSLISTYTVMLLPDSALFLMYSSQIILILLASGLFLGAILPYLVMRSITPKTHKANSATFVFCGVFTLFFIGGLFILIAGIHLLNWAPREKPVKLPASSTQVAPTSPPPIGRNLIRGTNMGRADMAQTLALAGIVLNISALILQYLSIVARLTDPLQAPFSFGIWDHFMVTFISSLCLGMILPTMGYHSLTTKDRARAGAILIISGVLTLIPLSTLLSGIFLIFAGIIALN